jgi:hypothetical protein
MSSWVILLCWFVVNIGWKALECAAQNDITCRILDGHGKNVPIACLTVAALNHSHNGLSYICKSVAPPQKNHFVLKRCDVLLLGWHGVALNIDVSGFAFSFRGVDHIICTKPLGFTHFEVWTLLQVYFLSDKPVGLYDCRGFCVITFVLLMPITFSCSLWGYNFFFSNTSKILQYELFIWNNNLILCTIEQRNVVVLYTFVYILVAYY